MAEAYFNAAATTKYKPQLVLDVVSNFYNTDFSADGRDNTSNSIVKETRQLVKSLFGATSNFTTVFTATATEAINVILQGQKWNKGDVLYLSPFEHNAIYRVAVMLSKKMGVEIELLSTDKTGFALDLESIRFQFALKKPTFICISHVGNVFGNVLDINGLGIIAKQYNAKYLIDCCQSAGVLDISAVQANADYIVFAGHKTLHSIYGCSGFVCKESDMIKPLIYGGTGLDSANEDMPKYLPARCEAGSTNMLAITALNAALKWIEQEGIENIRHREQENIKRLHKILSSYSFIDEIGYTGNNSSIISCAIKGFSPDSIGPVLADKGIVVRTGLHCSPLAHKQARTFPEGTVRFSVDCFTTEEEFQLLKSALEEIEMEI